MLLSLAFKNLTRYGRRSLLTLILIAFSITVYLWMDGITRGIREQSFDNLINFETGHIQIRTKEYDEKKPFSEKNFLTDQNEIAAKLLKFDFVTGICMRTRLIGEIDNGRDSVPVVAWGIEPEKDKDVFNLYDFISEGALTEGGALLGKSLASDLDMGIGDYVYFTTRTTGGMLDSIELEVTGIVDSADPGVNNTAIFISLSDAEKFIDMKGVSQIAVKTRSLAALKTYCKTISEAFPDHDVLDWKQLGESFITFAETDWKYGLLFIYLFLFLAFVGFANTMLMSVYEKKREIGTLKALGMTDLQMQGVFVLEGFWLGLAGCLTGIVFGTLFIWYFTRHPLDYSKIMGGDQSNLGYKVLGKIPARWSIVPFYTSVLMSLITSMGASIFAARQTTKMSPAECLRTKQ